MAEVDKELIISEIGQKTEITDEEKQALLDYQAVPNVNSYLHKKALGQTDDLPEDLKIKIERQVELLDAIFNRVNPLGKPYVVYRHLNTTSPQEDQYTNPTYVGTIFDPNTTLEQEVSQSLRHTVQELHLKPGQKAIYLPTYLPDPSNERELLLPRNSRFSTTERKVLNGRNVEIVAVVSAKD